MGAGSSRPVKGMQEIFRDSSKRQMQAHKDFIKTFLDRGYEIDSQEKDEDLGAEGELISKNLTTILKPVSDFSLPLLKFEAKEVFGKYFDNEMEFYPEDEARFYLKTYKKSADIKAFRDPWQTFELG